MQHFYFRLTPSLPDEETRNDAVIKLERRSAYMLPKLEAALRAITAIRESTNYTDRGFYIYYIPPGVLN